MYTTPSINNENERTEYYNRFIRKLITLCLEKEISGCEAESCKRIACRYVGFGFGLRFFEFLKSI